MIFQETGLPGCVVVELDRREDERGFFARAFCAREFEAHGLASGMVQANLSYNQRKGTVRGMHYQVPPACEPKFVRCIAGAVWDVVVDLRPDSATYRKHFGVELSAKNRRAIYIPPLFAHGAQTLEDDSELFYLVGAFYTPGCERGLRHDDPALGIRWPLPVSLASDKDLNWPLLPAQENAPAAAAL
jgi:dTDP-4-dehydrorhamnose 3,5-epimerase